MLTARTFHEARRTVKFAVRQAFTPGNLRGKRGQRNGASQLCTAKQLFRPHGALACLGLREPRCYPAPAFPLPQSCLGHSPPPANHLQGSSFQADFIMTNVDPTRMANAIRGLAMDAVEKAKSGHPGLPMGAADIATVVFTQLTKS